MVGAVAAGWNSVGLRQMLLFTIVGRGRCKLSDSYQLTASEDHSAGLGQ